MKRLLASVSASALIGMALATETVSMLLHNQPALGLRIGEIGPIAIYPPWRLFEWLQWRGQLPQVDIGLLILVLATLAGAKLSRKKQPEFGRNVWGATKDARARCILRSKPSGYVLGAWPDGRILSSSGPEHVLVAGPSRSGKTSSVVIPTLLTDTNSVFVFDPKRELWNITAKWRSTFSDTFYLDFTDPRSACLNPLDWIRVGTEHEIPDAQNLISIIVDPGGSNNDDKVYWDRDAEQLFTGVILYVLHCGDDSIRNLSSVRYLLLDLENTLRKMVASHHPEVSSIGNNYIHMPDRQMAGVKSTADSRLIIFSDPIVSKLTSRSDFRIEWLVCNRRPMSLYLQTSPSDATRLRPLTRIILAQVVTSMLEDTEYVRSKRKRHQLDMVIDEFRTLERLDYFTNWIGHMAQYRLRAMIIVQSDRNIADAYGPYNTIAENCPTQVIFPTSDDDTLKRISEAIGQDEEKRESRSYPAWMSGGHASRNVSQHRRNVMEPGQIRAMGPEEALLLMTPGKPLRTRKLRWWKTSPYKHRGYRGIWPQHPQILKQKGSP